MQKPPLLQGFGLWLWHEPAPRSSRRQHGNPSDTAITSPNSNMRISSTVIFTNGIHSLRVSKGLGKTHPNFTLYLLEKLCITGEAAAKGRTREQLSCTAHPPAQQGKAKARPWSRPGPRGSATPLTSSKRKKSNLNHRTSWLWQTTQVHYCPGGLQVAGSPVLKESLNNIFKFKLKSA